MEDEYEDDDDGYDEKPRSKFEVLMEHLSEPLPFGVKTLEDAKIYTLLKESHWKCMLMRKTGRMPEEHKHLHIHVHGDDKQELMKELQSKLKLLKHSDTNF